jgi:hypothetical protein
MAVADLDGGTSYSNCMAKLNNKSCAYGGNRNSKKIGHNTYIIRRDNDDVAVQYHSTDIVTYHKNGSLTVRTGGWDTCTTRGRLHQLLNHRVYSENRCGIIEDSMGTPYYLNDVVEINADGEITNQAPILADRLGTFLGKDIQTKEEMLQTISELSLEQMEAVWKKFRKDRGILARHCLEEFLPLALASSKIGDEPWMSVVRDRLQKTQAA